MVYEGAEGEARRQEYHDNTEMREGRSPESTEVAYTNFPKGTWQYPNPGAPATGSNSGEL